MLRYASAVLLGFAGFAIMAPLLAAGPASIAHDVEVYWDAALRLNDGSLYAEADPRRAYRYAPWFAVAWAPLTFFPREAVEVVWVGVQLVATAYLLRRVPWPAILVLGPALLYAAIAGNVHALMLAGIAYGLPRQSGPVFIALAASLKAFPLLFVLWYIGRREWSKAAWTLGLTVLLVAPMLTFDLSGFVTSPSRSFSLYHASPLLWAPVALGAAVVAVLYARTRYGVLWASVAVMAALPRLLFYDLAYLAVPLKRPGIDRECSTLPEPRHPDDNAICHCDKALRENPHVVRG